jgi:hypothetical protein
MKLAIKIAFSTSAIVLSAVASASSQTSDSLPSADDVVAKMLRGDDERRSELTGYTALRRYVAVNKDRRAEMVVRVDCSSEGTKQFTIISEEGSSSIRKHVIYKMLKEESVASRRETRDGGCIAPANYKFNMIGQDTLETGPAYVLAIIPKTENRYLIDGKIWSTPRTTLSFASKASLHEIRPSGCITCISFTRIRESVNSGSLLQPTAQAKSESLGPRN